MNRLQRYWINQPAEGQEFHSLHGSLVLSDLSDRPNAAYVIVYFTAGDVVSQLVNRVALDDGWPEHLTARK